MNFNFVSPCCLEPIDWRNPDSVGVGNSETSHIELSLRLSRRGHHVTSYTRLPDDCPDRHYGGVDWRALEDVDPHEPGTWALYRCPDWLDRFALVHPEQQLWLIVQDTFFYFTDEQAAKVDRVVCLCEAQATKQRAISPNVADKVCVSSNGIRVDMIEAVEAELRGLGRQLFPSRSGSTQAGPDVPVSSPLGNPREHSVSRNPHRLHFSSSPDRGLPVLLEKIFPRAKEYVPELELHVYYGWNNILKLMETEDGKRYFGPDKARVEKLLEQPGIVWHGRVGQRELTREWLKANLFVFPSTYPESSCASIMESQALGVFPIAHPLWGVAENTKWGTLIPGDPGEPLTQARYVAELVRLVRNADSLDHYRQQMMADARRRFSWDNWARQFEAWADGYPMTRDEALSTQELVFR